MLVNGTPHRTVAWEDGAVVLIDQPLLPHTFALQRLTDHRDVATAISTMVVRGAGAIGATGAYGLALAAREAPNSDFDAYLAAAHATLADTRPTAQNLFAGLDCVADAIRKAGGAEAPDDARDAALVAAEGYADADADACEAIGRHGSALLQDGWRIATHCNAGWLAFVDWGSALSPVYRARRDGKQISVFVDETRPRGQGARLTAWELGGEGVTHDVIADNAFAHFASHGEIQAVIVGSDRVAANGDVANKIGTFGRAVIARRLGIPFYVALPATTIDAGCPSGAEIPIEERSADEVHYTWGLDDAGEFRRVRTTPVNSTARNPAFDVTPADLVDGLITEFGVAPATPDGVARILAARDGRGLVDSLRTPA
jgi:methylthioribose-1-phosphate isomerase